MFLGTSGDNIVTALQKRSSAGIVIKIGGKQIHIDPGPSAVNKSLSHDIQPKDTDIIICSSWYFSLSGAINSLINSMTHGGFGKKGILLIPEIDTNKTTLTNEMRSFVEREEILTNKKYMSFGHIDIEAISSSHSSNKNFGIKIRSKEYTLGYTGISSYSKEFASKFDDSSILILTCKNTIDIEEKGFLNIENVKEFISRVRPQLALITGFGEKVLEKELLQLARDIQKSTGISTICATDGLFIKPNTYGIKLRQQSLKNF